MLRIRSCKENHSEITRLPLDFQPSIILIADYPPPLHILLPNFEMYFLTLHLLSTKDIQRCLAHINVLPRKLHVVAWKFTKLYGEVRFDKQVPNFMKRVRDIDDGRANYDCLDVICVVVLCDGGDDDNGSLIATDFSARFRIIIDFRFLLNRI